MKKENKDSHDQFPDSWIAPSKYWQNPAIQKRGILERESTIGLYLATGFESYVPLIHNGMKTNSARYRLTSFTVGIILFLLFGLACSPKTKFKPFDLAANPERIPNVDDNGFLINPLWGQQRLGGIHSLPDVNPCSPSGSAQDDPKNWEPCTDYPVTTNRTIVCGPHVNFQPIHYESIVFWTSHEVNDDDYNITFVSEDLSLRSVQSPDGILGEFDSDETIDHFETEWWKSFHHAVDNDETSAISMISGKKAITIGLLGLDCAAGDHNCRVELHPIYILAIQVSANGPNEHWVFFARNEGNEGYCSGEDQSISEIAKGFQYSITIPNTRANAFAFSKEDVRLFKDGSTSAAGNAFISEFVKGKGLKLTFVLADPALVDDDNEMVMEGDLELTWF